MLGATMPCTFGTHGECDGVLRVGNLATPDVAISPCTCPCHSQSMHRCKLCGEQINDPDECGAEADGSRVHVACAEDAADRAWEERIAHAREVYYEG